MQQNEDRPTIRTFRFDPIGRAARRSRPKTSHRNSTWREFDMTKRQARRNLARTLAEG